jgi:putative aldouronate transport system substrate-binding protein
MRGWGAQFTNAVFYGLGTVYGLGWDHDAEKYLYGAIHPEFKDALQYLNRLYKEDLLDPDFVASTSQRFEEKITSGKNFAFFENFLPDWQSKLEANVPGAVYDFQRYLTNDKGQRRGWNFAASGPIARGYAVNAELDDYGFILETIDWMYTEEGYMVNSWGREGDTYEMINGEPWFSDRILSLPMSEQTEYMFNTFGTANRSICPLDDARNWYAFGVAIEDKGKPIDTPFKQIQRRFANDPGGGTTYARPSVEPPLTEEEMDRVKEIRPRVDTIMEPGAINFITGKRPLSEFSDFVEELKKAGAEELEQIYNAAMDRL